MVLKVKLDEGAYAPVKAHPEDAGLDLRTPCDVYLPPRGSAWIDTGVHVQIPQGYCGVLVSKSGLNVKHSITSTGLIDSGYSGSIVVKLDSRSNDAKELRKGDKISQLVILPIPDVQVVEVREIGGGERGSNGFGSTGR